MQTFQRRLDHLDALLSGDPPAWWNDLLAHWRPSGHEAGSHGLRIAIRNNYLNFYRKGQSVARVEIGPSGKAKATLHYKYVDEQVSGQRYVTLGPDGVVRSGTGQFEYSGTEMLKRWIEAAEVHAGKEKVVVDRMTTSNPFVIDLEMGLPGTVDRKYSPRMDIVALEECQSGIHIVFWEAKLITDGRIRSRTKPEVLTQLEEYANFLKDDERSGRRAVSAGYQAAAALLLKLAQAAGNNYPLGSLVCRAAEARSPLKVDKRPRLVVVKDSTNRNEEAWARHEQKLRDEGIPLQVVEHYGAYALSTAYCAKQPTAMSLRL